jgi:hypothetical protein
MNARWGYTYIKCIVHIFNLSIQSGIFIDMFKISKIKQISKGGEERIF